MINKIKYLFLFLCFAIISGCATTTAPDLSAYSKPNDGTAGVYFYQWKTGILGSLFDVSFVLNGETLAKINTGEWTYLEVPSGDHQFMVGAGLLDTNVPVNFEEGNNYFFRGFLNNGAGYVIWVHDQSEIDEAIKNIESGRYKQIPSLKLYE